MSQKNLPSKEKSNAMHLQRYAYIDALRGIAIIGVLFAHVSHYSNIAYPSWLNLIATVDVGPRGVQLFYVVSAFTLCLSFSKRRHIEKHTIRNFYIRRFFRIAPLFYLAILYYLWQKNFWNGNPNHFSLMNILTTFTFLNGFFPQFINNIVFGGWSIAVETSFYILFPLLFYQLRSTCRAIVITSISFLALQALRLYMLSLSAIANSPDLQTFSFEFFPSQFPVFLIGMVIFQMMHEKKIDTNRKEMSFLMVGIIVLFVIQEILRVKLIAGHYIYGILFGIMVFILSKRPYKLLVNNLTVFTGKISYSLYLCHIAVYYWLTYFGLSRLLPANPYLNFLLRFVVLFGLSSLIASVLFFTVEKYGIILGKKLINKYEKITASYISSNARTW